MTGQPKKKLHEVEEFADQCFELAKTACSIIPPHYLDTSRRADPRDQIGAAYRQVYEFARDMLLSSETIENLLRVKAGLELRVPRLIEARDSNQPGDE